MPAAESFAHLFAGEQRKPVVDGSEQRETDRHAHDQVKVSNHKKCVVQVAVENGLSENRPGQSSSDEQGDEGKDEQQRGGATKSSGKNCRQPLNDLDRGRNRDGNGG